MRQHSVSLLLLGIKEEGFSSKKAEADSEVWRGSLLKQWEFSFLKLGVSKRGGFLGGTVFNPLQGSCLEKPMNRGAWQLQSMGLQGIRHDWSDWALSRVADPDPTRVRVKYKAQEARVSDRRIGGDQGTQIATLLQLQLFSCEIRVRFDYPVLWFFKNSRQEWTTNACNLDGSESHYTKWKKNASAKVI